MTLHPAIGGGFGSKKGFRRTLRGALRAIELRERTRARRRATQRDSLDENSAFCKSAERIPQHRDAEIPATADDEGATGVAQGS